MIPLRHSCLSPLIAAVFFCFYFIFCPAMPRAAEPQTNIPQPLPQWVSGDHYEYQIGFWLFRHAASGSLRWEAHPQGCRVVFEAETQGLVRTLAGNRKEVMESILKYDPAAQRFLPVHFQETFSYGKSIFRKTLSFDYERSQFTLIQELNKKRTFSIIRRLPREPFEDLLSFLSNLRIGAYGNIQQGSKVLLWVLMKERPTLMTVYFPQPPEKPKTQACRFYAILSMDRDITQAKSKTVRGWFSEKFIPLAGVVENAYFFGDLNVSLLSGGETEAGTGTLH